MATRNRCEEGQLGSSSTLRGHPNKCGTGTVKVHKPCRVSHLYPLSP